MKIPDIVEVGIIVSLVSLLFTTTILTANEKLEDNKSIDSLENRISELENRLPVNWFSITRDTLKINTDLADNYKDVAYHIVPLHSGLNEWGCALDKNRRVEFKIWNYE